MNSFSCTCVLSSDAVFDDLILSCTHVVSSDAVLDELAELFLVGVLVVVLQNLHVVADVLAEDVVAVHLGAEVAAFVVVAREALGAVRDLEPAVDGALERAEHLGAGGGARQAHVEVAAEGAAFLLRLHQVLVTVHLHLALVQAVHAELLQDLRTHARANTSTSAWRYRVMNYRVSSPLTHTPLSHRRQRAQRQFIS